MNDNKIFDFFISYKRNDTSDFVKSLQHELELHKYDVWLDKLEILPGDSILSGIEKGLTNSIAVILVFSEHYFDGWSEHERRAAFHLANSEKIRIIPIWYKIDYNFVQRNAPLFADIVAIEFDITKQSPEIDIASQLSKSIRPANKRSKLFEFFFKCLRKHFPDDPDLKAFVALFDNDTELFKEALKAGANPTIKDTELYNKYAKISIEKGCYQEWSKLYQFFYQQGELNSQSDIN